MSFARRVGDGRGLARALAAIVVVSGALACAAHTESVAAPPAPVAVPDPPSTFRPDSAPTLTGPPLTLESETPSHSAEHEAQRPPVPEPGPFARPWLGIEMQKGPRGVVVGDVFPGSAAEAAGLRTGDRLVALASAAIVEPPDVHVALDGHRVGEDITLDVERAGQTLRLSLRLGAKPDTTELMRTLFVGKAAPSISTLRTVSGSVVPSYSQLRGKVVVVEFWATWCVACRAMTPTLNRWFDGISAQGLRVLAVSSEPFEEVSNNLPQLGLRYPVFVDESTEVSQAYRAGAVPTLFLVDQNGVVRDVLVGFGPAELTQFEAKINALLQSPP